MSEPTKMGLVPVLRFPEFRDTGVWSEVLIGKVCKTFSGGTPTTTQKEYYGGDIPFIRSAEIDKEYTELFLTPKGLGNSAAKLVNKGDVLVALYGANSGEVALSKQEGAINQAVLCLKSESSNAFIYQFLSFRKDWIVSKYIQGGQGNLSGEIVKSINIPFPKPKEQQKIADCLSSIDELVTAQAQKVEALKAHKKGLMQQLFPAEGESVPKRRFPEFRDKGEWVLQKLEEVAKRGSGHTPNKQMSNYYNGGIRWVSLADSNKLDNRYIYSTKIQISKEGIENSSAVLHPAGAVILSRDAGVGKSAVLYSEMAVSQHFIAWICDESKLSNWFLYYVLQILKPAFERIAVGNTIKTIGLPYFKELCISVPSISEQKKIADCLTSIDELITAQTQKLDALKTHKKGLMQQLFPTVEEATA